MSHTFAVVVIFVVVVEDNPPPPHLARARGLDAGAASIHNFADGEIFICWEGKNFQYFCLQIVVAKRTEKIQQFKKKKTKDSIKAKALAYIQESLFRPSATVSRIGLVESRLRRRCHWCGGPPWLADPTPPHT